MNHVDSYEEEMFIRLCLSGYRGKIIITAERTVSVSEILQKIAKSISMFLLHMSRLLRFHLVHVTRKGI